MHVALTTVAACAAAFHSTEPAVKNFGARALRRQQPTQSGLLPQLTPPPLPAWFGKLLAPALVSGACLFGGAEGMQAAQLTDDQEIAAEAWYKADRNFVDRTFGGQDWFMTRQKMIKKKYDSRDDAYKEVRNMLATLNDKYTRFLTPSMYTAIFAVATGDVAGIGVELATTTEKAEGSSMDSFLGGSEGGAVKVSTIVEGAPSDQAGLLPGDVLLEADGNKLVGRTPEEAASYVRGPVGSKLRLVVERKGESEPLIKLITRASVKLEAVTSSLESVGGAKIGFIRVKQFSTTTPTDVKAALEKFGTSVQAYVLDLRGNTGGYFPGGVDVARLFLPEKQPITFVVDKRREVTTYETFEDGAYTSTPLLILVDGNTASASEVLSSALQDNGRAVLAGTQTFGKAVIQTVEELSDGSAVVVTIAKYQTPKKTDINKVGITVDTQRDCVFPSKAVEALACFEPDVKALLAKQ